MSPSGPPPNDAHAALSADPAEGPPGLVVRVRRIHRRDLNQVWDFLKLVFRDVNRETVEYQRPRSKKRFLEVYEEEGVEQLVFERDGGGVPEIVGYAECAFEITGSDNWMNERYFEKRDMRPLFVEELAVHPDYHGQGIGGFILEQLEHLARVRGCTHLVLEVAENNKPALAFYRARSFHKLDAAIFLAKRISVDAELLPPRTLKPKKIEPGAAPRKGRAGKASAAGAARARAAGAARAKAADAAQDRAVAAEKTKVAAPVKAADAAQAKAPAAGVGPKAKAKKA